MVRAGTKRKQPSADTDADAVVPVKQNGGGASNNGDRASSPASSASIATPPRKRGRPAGSSATAKKAKQERIPPNFRLGCVEAGYVVLTVGQGDTGQLGLGEDIMERAKPALVKDLDDIVDVCAGGMHSVTLNRNGEVYTFGCNDEGSLGRKTDDDDECYTPAKVDLPLKAGEKAVMIAAGDSHSVALTSAGRAFYWGTFRDSSGSFGLTSNGIEKLPIALCPALDIKKVASGADHIALLTQDGELYTLGCAEQGQLGRVGERFVARGGRRGVDLLLAPDRVRAKNRRIVYTDVWAGSYSTYALTSDNDVLVCGLNNYNQLGMDAGNVFYTLVKSPSFSNLSRESGGLKTVAPGQHHALVLDRKGRAHVIGRVEYGRLGMGEDVKIDAKVPTAVPALKGKEVTDVSCGTAVSFAVVKSGEVYSWGMGTNGQLAAADDEDVWTPAKMLGKQLEERSVLLASGGGQHTMLLAKAKK